MRVRPGPGFRCSPERHADEGRWGLPSPWDRADLQLLESGMFVAFPFAEDLASVGAEPACRKRFLEEHQERQANYTAEVCLLTIGKRKHTL